VGRQRRGRRNDGLAVESTLENPSPTITRTRFVAWEKRAIGALKLWPEIPAAIVCQPFRAETRYCTLADSVMP
jgi:hypothetical protein